MCRWRTHEWGSEHSTGGTLLGYDSRPESDYLVSDGEREAVLAALRRHAADGRLTLQAFSERSEEALAARTAAELRFALRDLPQPVWEPQRRMRGPGGPARWLPLPVLLLILVALVATHGWALIPLAWLLFGFLGPWRRHHRRRDRGVML